jgi:hypothetical protein
MLDRRAGGRVLRIVTWLGVLLAVFFMTRPASAYTWMIRHKYSGCTPCHADPTGAGLLTQYGRGIGEAALRTRYGVKPPDDEAVAGRFLWGVPTPDWLLLGGSLRSAVQLNRPPATDALGNPMGSGWDKPKFLGMQYDLKAQITLSRFRAYGSLGYMNEGAKPALITHHMSADGTIPQNNLVSREHWVGVDLDEDRTMLLRAGRINIPFGIRFDEHEMLTRSTAITRTNINESQQHGISFMYNGQKVRTEFMALLGNYQLNPDSVRERGYAGFLEYQAAEWATVGVSSMVTYARYDYLSGAPKTIRQAHGAFTRMAPAEPVVILVEADAVMNTSDAYGPQTKGTTGGFVSTAQVDYEPTQGLHLIGTGEVYIQNGVVLDPKKAGVTVQSYQGWLSALWFFAPHADIRFDFVAYSVMSSSVGFYLLPQLHVYL